MVEGVYRERSELSHGDEAYDLLCPLISQGVSVQRQFAVIEFSSSLFFALTIDCALTIALTIA